MARRRAGVGRLPFKMQSMRRTRQRFRTVPQRAGRASRVFPQRIFRNLELKFHDLDINDAVIAANGTIAEDSCNTIAQGVTEITRIGRKCTIRSINWRFKITLPVLATSNASAGDTIRVILYLDKQANGATAAVTDLLESDDFQSFNNLANKSRFRTLMDREYNLDASGGTGDGTSNDFNAVNVSDTLFKKVNIPIEYDSTTGAITEVKSNNIGVLLLGQSGLAGFESKMRLRFSDL